MLTELRSQMKLIMWILVVAFLGTIVFSWGMGGFKDTENVGVVGEIDGEQIEIQRFQQVIQRKVDLETRKAGTELEPDKVKRAREDAWDEYVENLLKLKDSKRLGIEVSPQEIAHIIENFPPPEVQQAEAFLLDGQFNPQAYKNFLRTPDAAQYLIQMEGSVDAYLAEQKLLFQVTQAADVTAEEVKDEYFKNAVKAKLQFLFVPFDDFEVDSSEITDEMMQKYYRMFPGSFKQYPQSQFSYVKFRVQSSAQDSADIRLEAEELLRDIRRGDDFASLAKARSDDEGSAVEGGDLGWFAHGKMVKPFEDAAFAAEPGQLLDPVESKFGLHIIKLEGKRKNDEGEDEIKASHILLKIEPSPETRDDLYTEAYNFALEVEERDFDLVAGEMELDIDTTKEFSAAGYVAGLGRMRMAATFCFNNPIGTVSGVYPYPEGYIVFKKVSEVLEGTKPFENVQKSIYTKLVKIIKKGKCWDKVADVRSKINTADDFQAVVDEFSLKLHVTGDSIGVADALPNGLSADKDFITEAFRLESGDISELIEGKKGYYIANMMSKSGFVEADFLAAHEMIYQSLIRQKQDAVSRNWTRELRIAADLQDYRYKFYRDF
ncbi:MAG: hypothetical protein HN757_15425 [Calditrichaeota bacterium]|nr:hypothetical protein [Calditrichota bacterium]